MFNDDDDDDDDDNNNNKAERSISIYSYDQYIPSD
jgi:hypothetical protein